jgi:hypothetical protein
MAFTENISTFFDPSMGFAVTATYDGTTSVNVIFDNEYYEYADGVGVSAKQPIAYCSSSDIGDGSEGKTLLIGSTTYVIVTPETDGSGVTRLILRTQ